MKQEDRALAESILKYLCTGRRICGVNFYAVPVLLIDSVEGSNSKPQAALTIESDWSIVKSIPETGSSFVFPEREMDQNRISELICTVGTLGWIQIIDVQLGHDVPHLLVRFENGQTLLIDGHHDQYESWNLAAGKFLVVATPGDELAIWCPNDFEAEK